MVMSTLTDTKTGVHTTDCSVGYTVEVNVHFPVMLMWRNPPSMGTHEAVGAILQSLASPLGHLQFALAS